MPDINGGRILVQLEGRDVNLTELINKVEAGMKRGATTARTYDTSVTQLTATQRRAESANAAYAQSLARTAVSTGDDAQAVRLLAQALQQLTPNTTAANNVLNQLQQTLNRQTQAAQAAATAQKRFNDQQAADSARASQAQASFATNSIGSLAKLATAYFAVTQAAGVFTEAINAGNALEKADATFRALSGSTAAYEKNIAAARNQQERFGGSLQDNLEGLSGFTNLAKRTGIEIGELAELARGLAVIDPVQGFKGASIALKEFFSGEITSLARRFEIPRDALNALKDIEDPIARFAALKDTLADFGITQELIASQTQTTAVAYDKLSGSAADAFAAIGQGLAGVLKPAAEQVTTVLQSVSAGINALNQSGDQKLAIEQQLITTATSAEEFNQRIAGINTQLDSASASSDGWALALGPLGPLLTNIITAGLKFDELTQAQLTFAQGALQAGVSLDQIRTTIETTGPIVEHLGAVFTEFPGLIGGTRTELDAFSQTLLQTAASGETGAITAQAYAQAVLDGSLSTAQGTAELLAYLDGLRQAEAAQLAAANAEAAALDQHERAAAAISNESTALGEQAIKTQESAIETDRLKSLQAELARLGPLVASGHITAANAAAFLASQYNLASGEAARLISLQAQLAGANAAARGTGKGKGVSRGGLIGDVGGAQTKADRDKLKKDADALLDAEVALAGAKGNTADQIALLRQKQQGLNKDSAEFLKTEAQIINLQNKDAKGGGRGGGGAKSPKLTANEKVHNQLLATEDKFNNQMEDLEEKHQQKLLDIIQEFAEKQLEVQRENEVLKRRSRFDFYSDLNKSEIAPVDKEKFAAAYEEAFARAQQIAQEGKAQLAQEFLKLKQSHIEELKQLAEEEANIKSDKDISGDERKRQLEELEARRKLLLDAQREEESQLLNGGDKLQNDFNQRIADENAAYDEQADKIATAADRAGDAKIRNAERNKIAVDAENLALAQQLEQYRKIAELNGGKLPNTGLPQIPVAPPTPIQSPEPLPIKPDQPLPIEGGVNALPVVQTGIFIVRDQGVIDALGDQTARLEAQLANLNALVGTMNVSLGGKLDGLRSAIGSSKGSNAVRP
jgi:hypothetical protein